MLFDPVPNLFTLEFRRAFLKSPETFRVDFEHANSHCIL